MKSVESLLEAIDRLDDDLEALEVYLPWHMTYRGETVFREFPHAILLNRLQQRGLFPDECEVRGDGEKIILTRKTDEPLPDLRTEPPPFDITRRVPALAPLAKTTIRLHPRRAVDHDPAASKFGGTFLWPQSEPWPRCDDPRHQTGVDGRESPTDGGSPILVGAVQLNARDFPEVEFRTGADLLQLLWCPTIKDAHDDVYMLPKVFGYWRNSATIDIPITSCPLPDFMEGNYFPISCHLHPERVSELPNTDGLYELPNHDELHAALTAEEGLWQQYQDDFGACPSSKVGGHPYWVQTAEIPVCSCGKKMEFLLQLCDWEV